MDFEYELAWYYRGIALSNLKLYQKALDSYSKAISINPYNDSTWYWRGIAFKKMERYQEAFDSLKLAIDINPERKLYLYEYQNLQKIKNPIELKG
ncbi:MAG: tetratricopeptide repeat protein [Xenococcaceae cyanobacterium]